jgi:hypothetical protein
LEFSIENSETRGVTKLTLLWWRVTSQFTEFHSGRKKAGCGADIPGLAVERLYSNAWTYLAASEAEPAGDGKFNLAVPMRRGWNTMKRKATPKDA